jgi:outer membrane protein OmpA-like peptidoglycan-associated protein
MIVSKLSKKVILGTAILACFSSSASFASDWDEEPADSAVVTYKEGHWGMGAGAVTGAAVGGPPGLVLGAIVGKLYGRHQGMQLAIDERDEKLENLRVQLSDRDKTIVALQQQEEKEQMMVASLDNVPMHSKPDFAQLIHQGFTYTIHFKTASDRIEDHLRDHCRALARMLRSFPDLKVNLEGYADPRGETSYNLTLSEKRIQAVKTLLMQEGIAEDVIQITAKGEQELLNLGKDQDSLSFDRRVVITFSQQEAQS